MVVDISCVDISWDFVPSFGSNSLSCSRKSAGCVSSTMFGQKIFINNLILIGSNPVIVLLLYISSPSCWFSRHHQHFFSCGLKHLLLASRLPCIQRLQLKWLMSQLAASLPLPTNYLTPWTFSLRSLELLLLLPLLPPLVSTCSCREFLNVCAKNEKLFSQWAQLVTSSLA